MAVDLTFDVVATELDERLQRLAAGDTGVGGLAWALSVGDAVAQGSAGFLHPSRRTTPMPRDAIFRIASVSKPIVAVAALHLIEQGLFGIDDPVDDVLPELADRRVLVDPTGPLDGDTVAAARSITLRDLLTFRFGLGMDFDFDQPQPVLDRMWELGIGPGPTGPDHTPDRFMELLGSLPLVDQPGTRWRYHTGSDVISVLIERIRDEPLDAVLARDVFDPIGMVDTGFRVDADRRTRLGECRMTDDGELVTWDGPHGRWAEPPAFRSGAAGLVSTTADLVAFGRMLLRGGDSPGGRVLSPESIRLMVTDHLDDEQRCAAKIDDGSDALGWGLGLGVRHRAEAAWPPAGSYGWDGGLGSRWLVDPDRDLCAVILLADAYDTPGSAAALDGFVSAVGDLVG